MSRFKHKITFAEPLFYIIVILVMALCIGFWTARSFYVNYSYATNSVPTKAEITRMSSSGGGRRGGGSMYYTVRFKDQNGVEIKATTNRKFGMKTTNAELFDTVVVWYDPNHPTNVGWKKGSLVRAYGRAIFPSLLTVGLLTIAVHLYRKFYHDLKREDHKKSSK